MGSWRVSQREAAWFGHEPGLRGSKVFHDRLRRMIMDRQRRRWSRVGMLAPLMLWIVIAGGSPIRGFESHGELQGEIPAAEAVSGMERVSVSSDGAEANGGSLFPSISADGRYVVFYSWADNLVEGDANEVEDVFLHDRQSGITRLVSSTSDGVQGNDFSGAPSISGDGRYVAFVSFATNLVDGDTNGFGDIFVHDRESGAIDLISISSDGTQGNGDSGAPSISGDGRFVAFVSYASNLVNGDTNGWGDVFVRDRESGSIDRISISSDGTQGDDYSGWPSISTDGHYVAFLSWATNLVEGDTNEALDVFVHDRQAGLTECASISSDGSQGDDASAGASLSGDGRYVAFDSWATNLVDGDSNDYWDVFVHDRVTGTTERVSVSSAGAQADGGSSSPSISGDGRYVVFDSCATNLVRGHFTTPADDVYVHDRLSGETELVSVALGGIGMPPSGECVDPSSSGDGRYVAFSSRASNLVEGDSNDLPDVFVHWGHTNKEIYLPLAIRD